MPILPIKSNLDLHDIIGKITEFRKASTSQNTVSEEKKRISKLQENVISQLKQLPCGLCPILSETVKQGVAYHHSGLTAEERKILEDAYRKGAINIIVATSTLSTGINLPAKAVIFHKPYVFLRIIIKL